MASQSLAQGSAVGKSTASSAGPVGKLLKQVQNICALACWRARYELEGKGRSVAGLAVSISCAPSCVTHSSAPRSSPSRKAR